MKLILCTGLLGLIIPWLLFLWKPSRFLKIFLTVWCILVPLFFWLKATIDSQNVPHHILQTLANHKVTDYWSTNNLAISYEVRPYATSNGVNYGLCPVTNVLWVKWFSKP
jgi:hypothetical protein